MGGRCVREGNGPQYSSSCWINAGPVTALSDGLDESPTEPTIRLPTRGGCDVVELNR